jgi:hypothetical protein
MKAKKQKYWLVVHARADEAVSAEEKHARFFEGIKDVPPPWGLGDRPAPPTPQFGRMSLASISLTRFFGDGVQRAMLSYVYRRWLRDDGLSDDALNITFDPAKVDVYHLIYTVIPKYIMAFDSYLVEYFDDQFIDLAWETPLGKRVPSNPRFNVSYVWPVSFFDQLLCRRAFNLSPAEVLARLQGKIEHAQLLYNGVYLVGSSQALPFDEARRLSREMKDALQGEKK